MQKEILHYNQYGHLIDELIKKIENIEFTAVMGILRGGLPIAVHVSHRLSIPFVKDIYQFRFEYLEDNNTEKRTLLIVDDIVDTGKTLINIKELAESFSINYVFAALYKRPNSPVEPDYYVEESPNWIVFPYETIEEVPSEYHQKTYTELFGGDK